MGWLSAVLGGVSNAISRRSDRRDAQRSFEDERRLANLDANQERETLLYQTMLEEEMRQNRRRERMRGGKNFAQFATMPAGYTNQAPVDSTARPLPVAPRIDL